VSEAQLASQAEHLSSTLGVLLVLATIFTSAQSQTLAREQVRAGTEPVTLVATGLFSLVLALISVAAIWVMWPVASGAFQHWREDPILAVFLLVWGLLVPLCVWQLLNFREAVIWVWRNWLKR
jgi:hypothetical protein